ncbi:alpha/beta fold hydrolase [Fertoebacter nigrum]|uniref:Alpha/beta fold hydrolase n=1 Tax=Fertoeibacter niger TaxID=2656921 RepID=A0A8X8KNE4_9RHOB|nr:alpha/beta hydrolase [Fertoeibacter niger]NUB43701.1 alpha/beta fold hydrolase [Fertoeibacter niger]
MMPLVLIPGMMCDARLFAPQMAAFARCPLLHAPCTEADSVEGLAAAVLAVAPPRFALAGLSMGGIVAMEVLRQAPGRVAKLALLDTNPLAETAQVQARRPAQIAEAIAGGLDRVMQRDMIPHYLADAESQPGIAALCLDMALGLGPEVFARQSRALATRPDQTATLAAFHGPALVLTGAHDRLCPMERHALMHRLMPQSRLVVIDGAGHLPVLEKPMETTAALRRWWEE